MTELETICPGLDECADEECTTCWAELDEQLNRICDVLTVVAMAKLNDRPLNGRPPKCIALGCDVVLWDANGVGLDSAVGGWCDEHAKTVFTDEQRSDLRRRAEWEAQWKGKGGASSGRPRKARAPSVAFPAWLLGHVDFLRSYAVDHVTNNGGIQQDAEDLASEVLVAAWDKAEPRDPKKYLRTAVRNRWTDTVQKARRSVTSDHTWTQDSVMETKTR